MDNNIYANRFGITTTESEEVFLSFDMEIPKFDDDGKNIGTEVKNGVTVVMNGKSFNRFMEMVNTVIKEGEK